MYALLPNMSCQKVPNSLGGLHQNCIDIIVHDHMHHMITRRSTILPDGLLKVPLASMEENVQTTPPSFRGESVSKQYV